MPIDYKIYPENWFSEIRPSILRRAGGSEEEDPRIGAKCECCGVVNYSVVFTCGESGEVIYHFHDGSYGIEPWEAVGYSSYKEAREVCDGVNRAAVPSWEDKRSVIVLTISHTDHDIKNNDPSNLKALCQRCHLKHDAQHHALNRKINKAKKAGQLFLEIN